jgi:predicted AlkP superfamily phosphohydrolase/phosphomutase
MRPVVIFGLDGATFTVLDDLVARGVMPYLGRFMAAGARGTLMSTVPPLTPPAWTTLVTGRTPGHHGITSFFQYDSADSDSIQIVGARQIAAETIWSMVSTQGGRTGCLNFVAHNPVPKMNRWGIPGWTSWRWMKSLSHPSSLIDHLKGEIEGFDVKVLAMDYEEERKAIIGSTADNYAEWVDLHIAREKLWFAVMKHLARTQPVDLLAVVFDGVDKLQHLLWPYLDPRLMPAKPSPEYSRIREMALNYFRLIDSLLEQTVEFAGDDATIIVCSDHGFTNSWEILFINTWLERNGYLTWLPEVAVVDDPAVLEPNVYRMSDFDMEKTRAYALTTSSNGIFINVKGGRNKGGIDPADYESFRNELCARLRTEVVDPRTGEPIITGITFREDAFAGPKMDIAPDLTLQLRDFGFISVRKGENVLHQRPAQMGTHHPEGILIAKGPGIRAGKQLDDSHLLDIAPTVLYAMGLDIPEALQGRVIDEMFTDDFVARHGLASFTAAAAGVGDIDHEDAPLEADDEILEKMKALGYIE